MKASGESDEIAAIAGWLSESSRNWGNAAFSARIGHAGLKRLAYPFLPGIQTQL
jgi:hypothetical protein